MRVIVDTNVFVSGLINPGGAPGAIVDAVLDAGLRARLRHVLQREDRGAATELNRIFQPRHRRMRA